MAFLSPHPLLPAYLFTVGWPLLKAPEIRGVTQPLYWLIAFLSLPPPPPPPTHTQTLTCLLWGGLSWKLQRPLGETAHSKPATTLLLSKRLPTPLLTKWRFYLHTPSFLLTCLLWGGLSWKLQRSVGVEVSTVTLPSLLPLLKLLRETAEELLLPSLVSDRRRLLSLLESFLVNLSTVKHCMPFVQSPRKMNRFRLLW